MPPGPVRPVAMSSEPANPLNDNHRRINNGADLPNRRPASDLDYSSPHRGAAANGVLAWIPDAAPTEDNRSTGRTPPRTPAVQPHRRGRPGSVDSYNDELSSTASHHTRAGRSTTTSRPVAPPPSYPHHDAHTAPLTSDAVADVVLRARVPRGVSASQWSRAGPSHESHGLPPGPYEQPISGPHDSRYAALASLYEAVGARMPRGQPALGPIGAGGRECDYHSSRADAIARVATDPLARPLDTLAAGAALMDLATDPSSPRLLARRGPATPTVHTFAHRPPPDPNEVAFADAISPRGATPGVLRAHAAQTFIGGQRALAARRAAAAPLREALATLQYAAGDVPPTDEVVADHRATRRQLVDAVGVIAAAQAADVARQRDAEHAAGVARQRASAAAAAAETEALLERGRDMFRTNISRPLHTLSVKSPLSRFDDAAALMAPKDPPMPRLKSLSVSVGARRSFPQMPMAVEALAKGSGSRSALPFDDDAAAERTKADKLRFAAAADGLR